MSTAPRFRKRFGTRVLLPGAMILAITGALCGFGLMFAGRNADSRSLLGQQMEVLQVGTKASPSAFAVSSAMPESALTRSSWR